jgi:Mor family transcriptional regulator
MKLTNGGSIMMTAINTSEIVYDINQGLKDDDLIRKYNISAESLSSLMKALVHAGVLQKTESVDCTQSPEIPLEFMDDCPVCGLEVNIDADKCEGCGAWLISPHVSTAGAEVTAHGRGPKKRKNAEELFLDDIRAGMDDAQLIKKYGISSIKIVRLLSKFLWEGAITVEEFEARRHLAKTVYMPSFSCPSCKKIRPENSEYCPNCGTRMIRQS